MLGIFWYSMLGIFWYFSITIRLSMLLFRHKKCYACAHWKIVCFLFLNVSVACHYYGVKNVTHAHIGKLCVFCF